MHVTLKLMIRLSRLNGKEFVVNCELIKYVESTPDTVITLSTNEKLMVRDTVDQVIEKTIQFRQRVFQNAPFKGDPPAEK